MIASASQNNLSTVSSNVSRAPVGLTDFEQDSAMKPSTSADDCKPLHLSPVARSGAQGVAFFGAGVMIAYLKPIVIIIKPIVIISRRQDV